MLGRLAAHPQSHNATTPRVATLALALTNATKPHVAPRRAAPRRAAPQPFPDTCQENAPDNWRAGWQLQAMGVRVFVHAVCMASRTCVKRA